ncbi:MAG: hypothetical protein IM674_10965 [Brevundimonas sp.]|nr:hypothetical protein [Brevundimonas sp.]
MSLFGQRWTAQDVGTTLGSFADEWASSITQCEAAWFQSNSDAEVVVRRYCSAALWMFAEDSPSFKALVRPNAEAALNAFQLNRLAQATFDNPDQDDESLLDLLFADAEAFGVAMAAPETIASGQPLARIAKQWFETRAPLPLFDYLPTKASIMLVSATGQLHQAVEVLVRKLTKG